MRTLMSVLRILSDGRFHSGVELGRSLDISRAAVWKIIQRLMTEWNITVQAVPGRGYRLDIPLELLDLNAIKTTLSLPCRHQIHQIEILLSVDSTNRYLLDKLAKGGGQSGTVVLAEHQTAGRGRRGRNWVSPFGQNLYVSSLWTFDMDASRLAGLSLAVSVAVSRTMLKLGIADIQLKWPNDVLWQGQKLCGILLEMHGETAGPWKVITGLGLNVNMSYEAGEAISQSWIDLKTILGTNLDRNHVVSMLLSDLFAAFAQYQNEGLAIFQREWRERDAAYGKRITLHLQENTVSGIARGIDKEGALCLEVDGQYQYYHAGEVSLRFQ